MPGLRVDTCLPSRRVTRALDRVIAMRGKPERIRGQWQRTDLSPLLGVGNRATY